MPDDALVKGILTVPLWFRLKTPLFMKFPVPSTVWSTAQLTIPLLIKALLVDTFEEDKVAVAPFNIVNEPLPVKFGKLPHQQKEFAMLDPDNNLLTFGQPV